jgi:hypothetical protein
MDIVSHGLWGSIAFGRKNKKSFWLSFFWGIAPDLFSFGIFFIFLLLGPNRGMILRQAPPPPNTIPEFVYSMYNITHSLVVFAIVFIVCWILFKRPIVELLAWLLHILLDIPTHSHEFFSTPALWPISDVTFNGIPWSHPGIYIPNVILLLILYVWFFIIRTRKKPFQ